MFKSSGRRVALSSALEVMTLCRDAGRFKIDFNPEPVLTSTTHSDFLMAPLASALRSPTRVVALSEHGNTPSQRAISHAGSQRFVREIMRDRPQFPRFNTPMAY